MYTCAAHCTHTKNAKRAPRNHPKSRSQGWSPWVPGIEMSPPGIKKNARWHLSELFFQVLHRFVTHPKINKKIRFSTPSKTTVSMGPRRPLDRPNASPERVNIDLGTILGFKTGPKTWGLMQGAWIWMACINWRMNDSERSVKTCIGVRFYM